MDVEELQARYERIIDVYVTRGSKCKNNIDEKENNIYMISSIIELTHDYLNGKFEDDLDIAIMIATTIRFVKTEKAMFSGYNLLLRLKGEL